jgi:hypothetical protein
MQEEGGLRVKRFSGLTLIPGAWRSANRRRILEILRVARQPRSLSLKAKGRQMLIVGGSPASRGLWATAARQCLGRIAAIFLQAGDIVETLISGPRDKMLDR